MIIKDHKDAFIDLACITHNIKMDFSNILACVAAYQSDIE